MDGGHTYAPAIATLDIENFRVLSRKVPMLWLKNAMCGIEVGFAGGIPSVNRAYTDAVKNGYITHESQHSTGKCLKKGQDNHQCRELCVGRYN